MRLRVIFQGAWSLVAVCTSDNRCPVREFLFFADQGDAVRDDKKRLAAYLDRLAHSVTVPRDNEITHMVDPHNKIWRSGRGQARVLWFYDEQRIIVLAHAFVKKTQKIPKKDLEQARQTRSSYFEAKKASNLQIQGSQG